MKRITDQLLVAFIVITAPTYLQAQSSTEKQIIPPSPNAAAIAKFGNTPVSYHTGLVNIEVPIYTIEIRDIKIPISLSYHAGGIKVSEEASRVGLGWALTCGGQITRSIINEDDFGGPNSYLNPGNLSPALPTGPEFIKGKIMEAGSSVVFYRVGKSIAQGLTPVEFKLRDFIYGSNVDYEPDQFSYSFAGNAGKFVMGRDRMPVLEKQAKISFEPTQSGDSWLVKTDDGFRYEFAASEYYTDTQASGSQRISAWYLTKIRSLLGEEVTFGYTPLHEQFIKPVGSWQQRQAAMSFSCNELECTAIPPVNGPLPRKIYSNIYLSSVTWKHGKVEFETDSREDLEGDIRIKAIKIYRKRYPQHDYVLLYEFRLDQSYFDNIVPTTGFETVDVTAEHLRKRLKLTAVRKYSPMSASDPEWYYACNYYEDQAEHRLPAKNSFSRDHWGFYNGRLNTSLIPSHHIPNAAKSPQDLLGFIGNERDPSPEHMKAYSLCSIRYPTGGTTTFAYEPHDYEIENKSAAESAFSKSKQFIYDCIAKAGQVYTDTLDLTDEYVSVTGGTMPVEISAIFRSDKPCIDLGGVTNVYFEIVRTSDLASFGRITTGLPVCESPDRANCIYCSPVSGGLNFKGVITLPPGQYYWRAYVPPGENRFQNISASITWWANGPQPSEISGAGFAYAGGLRIAQLTDYDPVVGRTHIRKLQYRYTTDTNGDGAKEEHSYGRLMSIPQYAFFDIFWEMKKYESNPTPPVYCLDCLNLILQSDSHIPATGSQGYAVGYSKVIEVNSSIEEGGFTEYEYFNDKDTPITPIYPHHSATFPVHAGALPTIPSALNGQLKRLTLYRSDSIPVRRIINEYELKFDKTIYGLEARWITASPFGKFDLAIAYSKLGPDANLLTLVYPALHSSLIVPKLTREIYFDSLGNEILSKSRSSSYDNQAHLQLTRSSTTTSDNRTESTVNKYAEDYQSQTRGGIAELKNVYLHSAPVEVTVVDNTNTDTLILARSTTSFSNFNGRILPKEIYELNVPSPLNSASVSDYIPGQTFNASVERLAGRMHYSPSGNVQQISGEVQTGVGYLWGYDDSLPIAEVRNASNLAYTSQKQDSSNASIAVTMGSYTPTVSQSFTFASDYKGTVYLKLGVPGIPDYSTTLQYSGLRSGVATLGRGSCGVTIIPLTDVPAGTHTITLTLTNPSESVGACGEILYPKFQEVTIQSGVTEFFLETFEESSISTQNADHAHTGQRYRLGDYSVNFSIPNSRRYRIEYWYYENGNWQHKISPYAGPAMLTDGTAIDDVRIYPDDAHMKSYTYDPLIGITSAIDEAGRATLYDYDEFGRLVVIRDDARNIEQAFKYIYRQN